MRLIKGIGLAIAGLVGLFLVVGFILPSAWHTERLIVIAADGEHILPLIDTPKRWIEWAPWTPERYPGMQVEYGQPERGAGAWWGWTGEESGNGRMDIERSDVAYGVDFGLAFEGFAPSNGSIRFEKVDGGTQVTWSMFGDNGMNLVGRYFGLMMDSMMAPDFDAGLTRLKAQAEAAKAVEAKAIAEKAAAEAARAEAAAATAIEQAAATE